jgi:hypothetical protein
VLGYKSEKIVALNKVFIELWRRELSNLRALVGTWTEQKKYFEEQNQRSKEDRFKVPKNLPLNWIKDKTSWD